MKKVIALILFLYSGSSFSQLYINHEPLAHTFSIVAKDSVTGDLAVAVQSHWFSVGTTVSWGESGVGVVATQSLVNKSFGLRGLTLLKEGKSPAEALEILLSDDEGKDYRQVSIMDKHGNVATHTGAKCIQNAGHLLGKNYSVQANMMINDKVWGAMSEAFEKYTNLPLAERIIKVLKAGQSAGGDVRGMQSAALLIVKDKPMENPWDDPLIDLRVDDHIQPIEELERLLKVFRAYEHMNNGDLAIEVNDMKRALDEYGAAEKMFPENLEMKYWKAIALANNGKIADALPLFKYIFKRDPNWRILTKRLPEVGILVVSEGDLKKIIDIK
ncbi:MAG: DUF1028 domain-containing protein [Cyclobacteriaceae bacterium]|nr:DUF1028 domain-containing protein [Cyclobacteriaceae bacterium]